MSKICYVKKAFRADAVDIIAKANTVCESYADQGYELTLRQLYYQFVARGWLPNRDSEYKRLGSIINDGRLAGLIDWNHLEDRTRNLEELAHWDTPQSIMDAIAEQYRNRLWNNQPNYVEVWVEKEALAGVVQRVAERNDVPYFSCRGYVSQSEMHSAGMRLRRKYGKVCTILHLGDHDPSGIDMTRDIQDRLSLFGANVGVKRIALNMDQIEQYSPPPNPAKVTDSRFWQYQQEHGDESWELDALDPATLDALIEEHVLLLRDDDLWEEAYQEQEDDRKVLTSISNRWDEVEEFVA